MSKHVTVLLYKRYCCTKILDIAVQNNGTNSITKYSSEPSQFDNIANNVYDIHAPSSTDSPIHLEHGTGKAFIIPHPSSSTFHRY